MVQGLVDRLKHRPWLALLIDGIGAMLSAFSLGVVLPACSIGSYCLRRNEWRPWLRAISRLNLAYCGVTAAPVVAFWTRLMFVGVTYFFLELLLIGTLVVVERPVLAAHDPSGGEPRQNHEKSITSRAAPR
jgi:hypothetical protein